ncbi:hypothetical protein MEZE111188_05645 [Mesobacillus zeae]
MAGVEYKVVEVENVIIDGSVNYAGSCSYSASKIEILNSLSETKKEQTLVHEMLHACFNEAGFNEQDEDVVNRVSIVLYQVLKDNKLYFGGPKIVIDGME